MTDQQTPNANLLPRDTRRSLPIALLRAREAVMSHFRPMLGSHELTEQQWRVMRVLAESDGVDASELAQKSYILAPSLTRIIRSLEERSLLTRAKDEADGRRALVKITDKGVAAVMEITPASRKIYADLETILGKEWIEDLLDRLDIVSSVADEKSAVGSE